jgi:hypothetical protein
MQIGYEDKLVRLNWRSQEVGCLVSLLDTMVIPDLYFNGTSIPTFEWQAVRI